MFVTGLLDGWLRNLDQTRRRHQQQHHQQHHHHHGRMHNGGSSGDGNDSYQSFLLARHEEVVWTPPELFEKCCAQWLAGGCRDGSHGSHGSLSSSSFGSLTSTTSTTTTTATATTTTTTTTPHAAMGGGVRQCRLKNGQWKCNGGCNKLHPTVTLFFDGKRQTTVAVLSCRLDPFVRYFDALVDLGVAICKTPYLYELEGFVRENLYHLTTSMLLSSSTSTTTMVEAKEKQRQRPEPSFGTHLVKMALGAMEESDTAHRELLETRHRGRRRPCQASSKLLDNVLQVCLLNRLEDDLDVLSLHCLQQTNHRSFRSLANSIISKRMNCAQLVVTPLVDGCYAAGYSVFRRSHAGRRTVVEREQGRLVEYAACPPIVCRRTRTSTSSSSNDKCTEQNVNVDPHSGGGRFVPNNNNTNHDRFAWACEELSFANLEREWGDIGVHEYIGQKVVVHWRRSDVDIPPPTHVVGGRHNRGGGGDDDGDGTAISSSSTSPSSKSSLLQCDLPIFNVRFNTSAKRPDSNELSMAHFTLRLEVECMDATQVDDVTISFKGKARVVDCQMDFLCLVSAYARSLEPSLTARHSEIEKTRPLLQYERDFLQLVRQQATVC